MGKVKDLTGQVFGRLTVLEPTGKRERYAIVWLCRCECGNLAEVSSSKLMENRVKSCGCLRYAAKRGVRQDAARKEQPSEDQRHLNV